MKFLRWAVTTALQSKSEELDTGEDSEHHLIAGSEKRQPEESLDSKLLRWLTASAILGKVTLNSRKLNDGSVLKKSSLHALQAWLECPEKETKDTVEYGCGEILASATIQLLKQLNFSHQLLPSSVSALCLLLLSESSSTGFISFHAFVKYDSCCKFHILMTLLVTVFNFQCRFEEFEWGSELFAITLFKDTMAGRSNSCLEMV